MSPTHPCPSETETLKFKNFDGSNRGRIPLTTATAYSVNTVFVQLNQQVGPSATRDVAVRAGIPDGPAEDEAAAANETPGLNDDLTNVLGSASPHPIDMVTAYSTFANRGVQHDTHIVKEVYDADGNLVYSGENEGEKVFEQDDIDTLNYALQGTSASGATAATAGQLGRPVAGKTGTSSGPWSSWYIGYIPQMVTAVDMYQIGDDGNEEKLDTFGTVALKGHLAVAPTPQMCGWPTCRWPPRVWILRSLLICQIRPVGRSMILRQSLRWILTLLPRLNLSQAWNTRAHD